NAARRPSRRRLPVPARSRWGVQIGSPPSPRSARARARWCRRNGDRHRRFRSRSIAGLAERRCSAAAEDWLELAAAEDRPGPAAAGDWPGPAVDWLGPPAARFPSRARPERERWFASRRASSAPWTARGQLLHPSPTQIPRLCGQTATESPHDRQDYDGTAATTEGLALLAVRAGVPPQDRLAAPMLSLSRT